MTDSPANDHNNVVQNPEFNGTTYSFYDDLQTLVDYPPDSGNPGQEYGSWSQNLYSTSSAYTPPVATHTTAWNQNAPPPMRDAGLTPYGNLQTSFQLGHYPQTGHDRSQQTSQPVHDQHVPPRLSVSPSHLNQGQPAMNQDLSYHHQQPSSLNIGQPTHSMFSQYPSQVNGDPRFDMNAHPHNAFYNYDPRQLGQAHMQAIDPRSLNGFADQQPQRPTAAFINPSHLNSAGLPQQSASTASSSQPQMKQPVATDGKIQPVQGSTDVQPLQVVHQQSMPGVVPPPAKGAKVVKPRTPKDPNAPKRPRGRPRKDGTMPRSKITENASSDSESDELQIEAEEPVPMVLRGPRPIDPTQQIVFDVTSCVWFPRNRPAVVERVQSAIAVFGDIVKRQRDAWKVKNEALKQAELASSPQVPKLKLEVAQYRVLIEAIALQAVQLGHPSHLAKLGENPFTMSALQSFLLDRINVLDMDGSLVTKVLKLMLSFTTLDSDMLEKTKTAKILSRLAKKAGDAVKKLAQTVLDQAAAASKRKAEPSAKVVKPEPSRPVVDRPTVAVGLKRSREIDGANLPATKRSVVPASVRKPSKPLALQNAERKKLESAAAKAKPVAPPTNDVGAVAAKPAVGAIPLSRPTPSPFSGLMSASKKPGTSNAARAAAVTAAKDKASSTQKKASPPRSLADKAEANIAPVAKSTFSFIDTLADMSRPKHVAEKKVDDRPPEKEEERKKRLRKEERRKLRVTWAPESELTKIRIFELDPDEVKESSGNALRDVGDIGGEGRMLKLHKDMDDLDDDDDSRVMEDLAPFYPPTEVDFSDLEDTAGNFYRRGGATQPESPEKAAQEAREETTLMVVYALPSDVPPTPKEPISSTDDDDDYTPPTSFGDPGDTVRDRESKYEKARAPPQPAPTPDISSILAMVKNQQAATQSQPSIYNPFPQAQPPTNTPDISSILAMMSHLPTAQPSPQPTPAFTTPQPQTAAVTPNIAALLAQMQAQQQSASASQHQPNHTYPSATGNPNPYPGPDNDRKHARPSLTDYDYDEPAWKKGGSGSGSGKHPKNKTVVCKFWLKGECRKGSDCTFIHE